MTVSAEAPTRIRSRARPAALGIALAALLAALLVVHVQGVAADGGRAAWSSSLVAGSAQCVTETGFRKVISGEPCPLVGGPRGSPFILGGSEALATAAVMRVTGTSDPFAAMIPVGILISLLGFSGGVALLRQLGVPWLFAIAGSTAYAVMPFTLGIQIFLGTGSGVLLLPLYAAADLYLIRGMPGLDRRRGVVVVAALGAYVGLRWFAVFLDGYTFLMSLLVAGVLLLAEYWGRREWSTIGKVVAMLALANGSGVLLYLHAVNGVGLEQTDLAVFRGWGLDVITAVQPNDHLQWARELGFGPPRQDLYSDFPSTAWNYLGIITLLLGIAGTVLAVRERRRLLIATAVLALLSAVLALGPALKVEAEIRPQDRAAGGLLPAGHPDAVELPWDGIYSLPGVSGMRYPYRWSAVTRLALIALAMFALARVASSRNPVRIGGAALIGLLLIVELFPTRATFRRSGQTARVEAGIRDELVPSVLATTNRGMRVVFVDGTPVANEYLVNPVAAMTGIRSYNVGIDKNLFYSQAAWPPEVSRLILVPDGTITAADVLAALRSGGVDAVVFPDVDLVASINRWPTPANTTATAQALEDLERDPAVEVRHAPSVTTVVLR